jgi:hypothetical protein
MLGSILQFLSVRNVGLDIATSVCQERWTRHYSFCPSGTLETSLTVSLFGEGRALTDRERYSHKDWVQERKRERKRERERQTDRHIDKQSDRQTTDRQTDSGWVNSWETVWVNERERGWRKKYPVNSTMEFGIMARRSIVVAPTPLRYLYIRPEQCQVSTNIMF